MLEFKYFMPTKIIFGAGKLAELAKAQLPGVKPLVVTSAGGSMRRSGTLERVLHYLQANGCRPVLYEKIAPNPVLESVDAGAELARKEGCDFVVGLGGGSPIDAAKAIATTAANGGSYWDFIGSGSGKGKSLSVPALPLIAIPTTAGTGTEADPWCVITRTQTKEKTGWGHDSTFPVLSIVDPELMLTVPPQVTAMTGMDAFFHSVEAYLATCHQPASDLLALEAVQLIAQFLPRAVQDGKDIEARTQVAWASTAAGLCESYSSCIAHHSMEHSLSAFSPHLPHGAGLTMQSLPFLTVMAQALPERCARLAAAMGADVSEEVPAKRGLLFVARLKQLIKSVGLADLKLSDYGLKPEMADELAENAFYAMGGLFEITPVKLSKADVAEIFRKAF
ncbi:MAG: iron-containing alcohol dehydrogenase [Desulfovibrionaceae bacterium]